MPFEIHPEISPEGKKLSDAFPGSSAKEMMGNLNAQGNQYGVYFSGKDAMFNSEKALLATEYARDNGKLSEFHGEVCKAYFTQSINIADSAVLKEIAETVGLDGDAMLAKVEDKTYRHRLAESKVEATKYGIQSVPTFIIDNKYMIVGAQPIDTFRELLSKSDDAAQV